MQRIRKYSIIIGLALLIGLTIQANNALALYSPRLSQQVSIIRQHVQSSQAQNGTQSVLEEVKQVVAYDKARREAFEATGISGEVRVAQQLIFDNTLWHIIQNPADSIMMVFSFNVFNGEFISSCLRDEIWSLETLRDLVGSEMIKAYMLRDTLHGKLLKEDYQYLVTNLDLLRRYGSNPNADIYAKDVSGDPVTIKSTKYFFGDEGDTDTNLYNNAYGLTGNAGGCPAGEFQEAFREVVNSVKTVGKTVGGNSLFSGERWGSIYQMAKANARTKANQWIKANQVSLTIGGKEGGRVESLVKGGGWDKFAGSFKTQLKILKNMVGPVTPIFTWSNYRAPAAVKKLKTKLEEECVFFDATSGVFKDCTDGKKEGEVDQIAQYAACKEDAEQDGSLCDRFRNMEESISVSDLLNRQALEQDKNAQAKKEAETAFVYKVTLDSVAEQNIYFMDEIMVDMNSQIERGYKETGVGIPVLTRKVGDLTKKHCPNKK